MHNNVKLAIWETRNKLSPVSWGGEPYNLDRFITVLPQRGVSSKLWGRSSSGPFPCVWIGKVIVSLYRAREGNNVLDLCCGSGDLAFLLSEKVGPNGKVCSSDLPFTLLFVSLSNFLLKTFSMLIFFTFLYFSVLVAILKIY